ncbi:uncharacterized protein si:ch211-214j8.12 [Betta splendens]|uniref:Uncharacterized protein si:ch211-214j8.12 n=1 Tax=Betta splendens TaxID=158456 RepID=A0A8M1HJ28_BETSP|nr:uncharacterized protein si:ch211-214j8.12 [Betta splendens]
MPLFRACSGPKLVPGRRRIRRAKWTGRVRKTEEDGSVPPLTRLCLLSLADHMKDVWAKDYADNYLDQYSFRHIMGPFNLLPGDLVEELLQLLCSRQQLSRAALHLLLLPQLRSLSLHSCPGLVTSALCGHIVARCQGLWSLDLSGAQQLPAKALSETLCCLSNLRSLSLAGMPCDGFTIRTIARGCRLLRHLDVSRCHLISPAALLSLGGGAFCSSSCSHSNSQSHSSVFTPSSDPSSSSSIAPLSPLPLSSLLALDIGFGDQEKDPVAAAAYLLLSLPCLERIAIEGFTQACCLIRHREFSWTNEFADREGVPRLEEVWRERRRNLRVNSLSKNIEEASAEKEEDDEEEEGLLLWGENSFDIEEAASRSNQAEQKRKGVLSQPDDECITLHLKDVRGLTCDSLDSLGHLCPDLMSMSINIDGEEETRGAGLGSLLAAGLQTWSGQLRYLSVQFSGPLLRLLPALKVSGSSLASLTLEGVKTSPHTPLLEVMQACPRLRDLDISAEPPCRQVEEEDGGDQQDDRDHPRLPNLCSLRLNFFYEHSQMKPIMSWMALKKVLKCLLAGSPLLEKLSLVALPCPLDSVLEDVLQVVDLNLPDATDPAPVPLGRLQHIGLPRSDVKMVTVKSIMQRSQRLKSVDVSYCWQISQKEWLDCRRFSKVHVVWV